MKIITTILLWGFISAVAVLILLPEPIQGLLLLNLLESLR